MMEREKNMSNKILLFRDYKDSDLESLDKLVSQTIKISYPAFYNQTSIKYFLGYNSLENIRKDCRKGYCVIAEENGVIIGTGSLVGTNIRRVYIDPGSQGKGIGHKIMGLLEDKAREKGLNFIEMHASLFAKRFYDTLGYISLREASVILSGGSKLNYFRMAKGLNELTKPDFDLHNKLFRIIHLNKSLRESVEASFVQVDSIVYMDFYGGNILSAEFTGIINGSQIEFTSEIIDNHHYSEIKTLNYQACLNKEGLISIKPVINEAFIIEMIEISTSQIF